MRDTRGDQAVHYQTEEAPGNAYLFHQTMVVSNSGLATSFDRFQWEDWLDNYHVREALSLDGLWFSGWTVHIVGYELLFPEGLNLHMPAI
jgi:hypothetical protein